VVIALSIVGQLLMGLLFGKEALLTTEGTFCRLKCLAAAGLFLFIAIVMSWSLYTNSILSNF
jgi:hypothetical protein